jgi:hypothetical protein
MTEPAAAIDVALARPGSWGNAPAAAPGRAANAMEQMSAGRRRASGVVITGQIRNGDRAELERSRLADGGHLSIGRRRVGRIRTGTEVRIAREHILMICQVEDLAERFGADAAVEMEGAADPQVEAQEALPTPAFRGMNCHRRSGGRSCLESS